LEKKELEAEGRRLNAEGVACNEMIRDRVESLYSNHFGKAGSTLIFVIRDFCDWWQSFERKNSDKTFTRYSSNPRVK